jgi:CPA1 family monovalent cation:H+ antiporter
VPKRLAVLIEGESLLNDGTALVLFNRMLVVVATGSSAWRRVLLISANIGGWNRSGVVLGWAVSG